jgi:hypothetical protein
VLFVEFKFLNDFLLIWPRLAKYAGIEKMSYYIMEILEQVTPLDI